MAGSIVDELLARAFEQVPARDANEAIGRIRREQGSELAEALSYEVVLPAEGAEATLRDRVLPRLVYFLDSRGAQLPDAAGVVVSVFQADRLYFLHARDVLTLLATWVGLPFAELVEKYGAASV